MKAKLPTLSSVHRNVIPLVKDVSALLLALLIVATFSFFNEGAEGKEPEILLLHTNSVTGHLFPCPT